MAAGSTELNSVIKELSKHIGRRWKPLARELGLSSTEIEAIEDNNKSELEEQIFQFFHKWKQQQGLNASVERLIKGLKAAALQKEYDSLVQAGLVPIGHGIDTNTSQSCPQSDTQLVHRNLHERTVSSSGVNSGQQPDRLQNLGQRLFTTLPYRIFQICDNSFVNNAILCIFVVILLYQFAVTLVLGACEDGGFPTGEENGYIRIVHRLLLFLVRIGIRVVTLAVFMLQLTVLAKVPETPCFGLSEEDAAKQVCNVYEKCTYAICQEKDLQRMQTDVTHDHENVFHTAEELIKRPKIIWLMVILNPFLFTYVLFHVGAFQVAEEKNMILDGGFCKYYCWVPGEYLSAIIIILIVGVVKEFYCFENTLSTYAILIGAKEAAKISYEKIRNRWQILDWYCYCMPLVLVGVAILSSGTGKAFMPKATPDISTIDVISWFVWIVILSAIVFLASFSSEFARYTCICLVLLYIICACIIKYDGLMLNIPATGDCSTVFQYIALAILNFNLIFTLCRCHYYYYHVCKTVRSFWWRVCMVCMVLLIICILLFSTKEVVHLI